MNNFVEIANRIRTAITTAVTLVMAYALLVSAAHITHVVTWLGVPGWQAKTAFVLVDLPALIGKVMQLKYFAPSTRKAGRKLTYFSGSLSLACNIGSGLILGSFGAAGWGAFVVVMFLVLESVAVKIKPAAAVTRAKNAANETKTVQPTKAGRKCAPGCTCGKHKAAYPVSPGVGPVGAYAGRKA